MIRRVVRDSAFIAVLSNHRDSTKKGACAGAYPFCVNNFNTTLVGSLLNDHNRTRHGLTIDHGKNLVRTGRNVGNVERKSVLSG